MNEERRMMKMRMVMGLTVACAMTGVAATNVSFTAAEGYASALLDTQNGWSANAGWSVDSSGSGSAATTSTDQRAVYGGDPIILGGTGQGIKIRVDFSYGGTPATPSANTLLGAFGVSSVSNTGWTEADQNGTYLFAGTVGTVRLRNDLNIANLTPTASLDLADIAGDDLAIEYTVMLGSDAASSYFSAKLINVTDATESALGSYTGLDQNVFDAATTTGIFPTMWGGNFSGNGTGITGVTVDSISWQTVEVVTGTTVDFTSPLYSDGPLNGQNYWSTFGTGSFVVDTTATTVSRSTDDWGKAIYGGHKLFASGAEEGASATVKADFYFEGVRADVNSAGAQFGFSNYSVEQRFYVSSLGNGTLQLRNNVNAELDSGIASIPLPGTNDALRITYTLTLGADAASSTMTATLLNTVTSDSATGSYTGIDGALYASATTNGIYFAFLGALYAGNTALVLDQVNLDEAAAPEPPPEGIVDFTSPLYKDGQLNLQNGWSASTGGDGFVVDTAATTVSRASDYGRAVYGGQALLGAGAAVGDSATATADFYFAGALSNVNNLVVQFGFADGPLNTNGTQRFYLRSSDFAGTLNLRDQNAVGIGAEETGIPLPGTNDALRITYTLTLGADAASSVMSATLSNTVSGASAAGSYSSIDPAVYTAATNAGIYFTIANATVAISAIDAVVLDKVELQSNIANPPSGFDLFADAYGLSGVKTDDDDLDTLNDWGEYVFGGDPTNANDIGTQPSFDAASGDYTFALIGDDTVVAHVVTTEDLVVGSWNTNATVNVSATDGVLSNYIENVGTAANELFIKLLVE